ncbi:helix-turn-helix transcriptional regulator [Marinicaulis aureus]|uniref:Helix-turn-helix transcriptional regulator n=1 Tax=Hyphococcus aureus TaxID=2666033 RepID=A0ABW1KZ53_9PROT
MADAWAGASGFLAKRAAPKLGPVAPCDLLWWIFTASVTFSVAADYAGDVGAPIRYIFAIGGSAGCGWLWLLSRTLFRAEKPIARWNVFAVAAIIAVESYWALAGLPAESGEMRRIAANATSLICIGAVVLVFVEALSGYSAALPKHERRFRQLFTLVFGAMIAVTFLWAMNANETSFAAQWAHATLMVCAAAAVIGARLAVSFRKRYPLPARSARKAAPSPAATDESLAQRILAAIETERRFATPDLKIADLAASLGEHDYKVTQCISGFLGYRNFNHLINARRIDYAKQLLSDPDHDGRSILSIAFDCGFSSIGPFNRAFKSHVGMTPREFRNNPSG